MKLEEILKELEAAHDAATVDFGALALAELALPLDELARLLEHNYRSVRRAAVLAIGRTKPSGARARLAPLLNDRAWLLRRDTARALGTLGDRDATGELEPLLGDPRAAVRESAVEALAALGGRTALEALARPREERDRLVRRATVEALRRIGQESVLASDALTALFALVARENDEALRDRALTLALEIAKGRESSWLSRALGRVPQSGRTPLANALASRALELEPALTSQIDELRAEPIDTAALAGFGSDLTARLKRGPEAHTYRREREIEQMLDRLKSDGPRSLVLVGPSGAGKTALMEELGRRLAQEGRVVPPVLLEVSTGDVLAGTRYLGEWQTRLKKLVDSIRKPKRVIWYCPDVNGLVDAGRTVQNETECLALMLAPYLERGEVAILGESTPELLRRGLEREPQVRKLFQTVRVEEMSPADALSVLASVSLDLAKDARERLQVELVWPEESLALALELGQVFFPGIARPGNGIKLLREATNAALEAARTAPAAPARFVGAGATTTVVVTPAAVTRTLSSLTGVPELLLNDEVPLDLQEVRRFFSDRVLGQNEAVQAVVDLIAVVKAGLADPMKPLGVFFFVGPTGVGKTEMAKALAEFIYGSPERLVRLDMADYQDALAFRRLTGDAAAVDSAARSGKLTAPVQERPFSVVLLDEIEKAHPSVFDLLLPVMDDGRLSDDKGRATDFRRTIIIMTSNVGSDLRQGSRIGFSYGSPDAREKVERIMAEHFRPEFLNRIDKTVIFSPLSLEVMRKIARREVGRVLLRHGIARRKVVVDTDDSVVGLLLKEGFSERFGARPLKRRVEQLVLQPLARSLVALEPGAGPTIVQLRARGDRVSAERIAREAPDEDEDAPVRPTARIRDPRDATRRISTDDLTKRAGELATRLEGLELHLDGLGLRSRKDQLLRTSNEGSFWNEPARARTVMAEIAALEKAIDAPIVLRKRLDDLNEQLERAQKQGARDPGLVVRAAERWDELARDVEFSDYAARCVEPRDRGDAYVFVRRVGERAGESDVVARLGDMYLGWARRKGLSAAPVLERLGPDERVTEVVLRIEGVCAFGLLRGEEGLHQWIDRRGVSRTDTRSRDVDFARVEVLAPADFDLRDDELKVEVRPLKKAGGKLMKRHRVHVVLTHDATMLSVEGASERKDEVLLEARAVLAARVAAGRESAIAAELDPSDGNSDERTLPNTESAPTDTRGGPQPNMRPGIVRRYVLSTQPVARDLASGLKAPLEQVLEGNLDDFVAKRLSLVS